MDDSFYNKRLLLKRHSWKVCHSICRYPLPLLHPPDSCSVCDCRPRRALSCVCVICASCASSSFCPLCRRSAFSWICTRYFCCCRCRCPTPFSPSSFSSSSSSPGGRTRKGRIWFCVAIKRTWIMTMQEADGSFNNPRTQSRNNCFTLRGTKPTPFRRHFWQFP